MIKNSPFKRNIFLLLFIIACFSELYLIACQKNSLVIFSRIGLIVFLSLFYIYSVKQINKGLLIVLASFLLTDFLSIINIDTYGMLGLILARVVLIKLTISNTKTIDWRIFKISVASFSLIAVLILSLFYRNDFLYYASLIATLCLIIFSSFAFMNLVKHNNLSDLLLFLSAILFIISDAVFGVHRFGGVLKFYPILASLFYDIAFFLVCLSEVKRINKRRLFGKG